MDLTAAFQVQRPRLLRLAARVLADHGEAEDVVQLTWMRLHASAAAGTDVVDLPAWLTTVTTRLCLDRLRSRTPVPTAQVDVGGVWPDPAHDVVLTETVGMALRLVLDRLTPTERVALVLHDSFSVDFAAIAAVLETTPAAARKAASRARAKVRPPPEPPSPAPVTKVPPDRSADADVVDAFMAAARGGDLDRLVRLLAPDAEVTADVAAVAAGTPERITGRQRVAEFFDGSARAALPATLDGRPVVAWYHRGEARVVFDVRVVDGRVQRITFRAAPEDLARLQRRTARAPS